jgi:hypothetical protein
MKNVMPRVKQIFLSKWMPARFPVAGTVELALRREPRFTGIRGCADKGQDQPAGMMSVLVKSSPLNSSLARLALAQA